MTFVAYAENQQGGRVCPRLHLGYQSLNLYFPPRAGQPALVYRRAFNTAGNEFIQAGLACLQRAAQLGIPVPRLYDASEFASHCYYVVEFVPGRPVTDAAAAVAALTTLHQKSRHTGVASDPLCRRVAWWQSQFTAPGPELPVPLAGVVAAVAEAARTLPEETGGVLMHGDCVRSNLLADAAGAIWWLDWELGLVSGWPAVDLITWLLESRLAHCGACRGQALAQSFIQSSPTHGAEWRAVEQYAEAIHLPRKSLPALVAVTMLKLIAEDRHYLRLHQGPCQWGPALSDLDALRTFLERYPLP